MYCSKLSYLRVEVVAEIREHPIVKEPQVGLAQTLGEGSLREAVVKSRMAENPQVKGCR